MTRLAERAVHGSDRRAESADVVFFRSQAEACGSLLTLLGTVRYSADAWFWPAVDNSEAGASPADRFVDLIETLRASPASWSSVAAVVMETLEAGDPVGLLTLLADAAAARWVRALGGDRAEPHLAPVIGFPAPMHAILARAIAALGRDDSRVLWLASLAVVLTCPSDLDRGTVVARARASLSRLAPTRPHSLPPDEWEGSHPDAGSDLKTEIERNPVEPPRADGPVATSAAAAIERPGNVRPDGTEAGAAAAIPPPAGASSRPASAAPPPVARPGGCFGEATQGAGLYFLLNALRRLRTDDDAFDPWFLAHLFQHLARYAEIGIDDPILLWTYAALEQAGERDIPKRRIRLGGQGAAMVLAARPDQRQGHRAAAGKVTLTRTDLDVTLALDLADVRIRRIGLDLDPGWVPWFGRVVRFHYLTRAGLHA